MIIFGWKEKHLLSENLEHVACQSCGHHGMLMTVFVKYFHLFRIPMFPYKKMKASHRVFLTNVSKMTARFLLWALLGLTAACNIDSGFEIVDSGGNPRPQGPKGPPNISSLSATAFSAHRVQLKWNYKDYQPHENVNIGEIERREAGQDMWKKLGEGRTNVIDFSAKPGQQYFYRVRWQKEGEPGLYGSSPTATVTTFSNDKLWVEQPPQAELFNDKFSNVSNEIPTIVDVDFIDNLHGLAIGYGRLITRTSDGGMTWSKIDSPTLESDEIYLLQSVRYLDEHVVIVAGNNSILRSTNGGVDWTLQKPSDFGGYGQLWSIATIPPNVVILVGIGSIYRSEDSGVSWRIQTVPQALSAITFYDTHFFSADTGMVAGYTSQCNLEGLSSSCVSKGVIFLTEDGGATWVDRSPDPDSLGLENRLIINRIHFFNHNEGIATNGKVMLKTEDGGLTWRVLPISFSGDRQRNFRFLNRDVGFSVGNGTIWRISDAGETWVQESIPTTLRIFSLAFTDANRAVAVGSNALVLLRQF